MPTFSTKLPSASWQRKLQTGSAIIHHVSRNQPQSSASTSRSSFVNGKDDTTTESCSSFIQGEVSAWFCHQMMAREINYFVNALLIVMVQADCKNHLLITSFITPAHQIDGKNRFLIPSLLIKLLF
jgi:hypothetical protein